MNIGHKKLPIGPVTLYKDNRRHENKRIRPIQMSNGESEKELRASYKRRANHITYGAPG